MQEVEPRTPPKRSDQLPLRVSERGPRARQHPLGEWLAVPERRLFRLKLLSAVPGAVGRFVPVVGVLVGGLLALGHEELARCALGVGLFLLAFNLGVVHRPRLTRLTAALELDARLGPESALGPAYAFSRQTSSELGPYERFILESELNKARQVDPRRLLPLPKKLGPWMDLVNLLLVATLFFVRVPERPTPSPTPGSSATAVPPYPIEDLRAHLEQLGPQLQSEPATDAFKQTLSALERFARGAASEEQTLLALKDLETTIERSAELARGISEGLEETGRVLERVAPTRPLGKALREKKLDDAARALEQLEERLSQGAARLSPRELEKLRQDLTRLVEARSEAAQASASGPAADQELRSNLEKRQRSLESRARSGPLKASERAEKEEIERRLATLERRKKAAQEAQKAESELDRQLAEAARALSEQARGDGPSGQKQRAGGYAAGASESLRQLQSKTLTDTEKQALLTELRRMKERLGEGGEEAEKARAALRAFEERARQGQSGQAKGRPNPGEGSASGSLRPSGNPTEGQGESGEGLSSLGESSSQPGGGHDENLVQKNASPEMEAGLDVTAAAQDLQGESEAEVVERAAKRGFASPNYRRLYLEYRAIDEEVLARDQVPPGYASRVLRYFELIEPAAPAPLLDKND